MAKQTLISTKSLPKFHIYKPLCVNNLDPQTLLLQRRYVVTFYNANAIISYHVLLYNVDQSQNDAVGTKTAWRCGIPACTNEQRSRENRLHWAPTPTQHQQGPMNNNHPITLAYLSLAMASYLAAQSNDHFNSLSKCTQFMTPSFYIYT